MRFNTDEMDKKKLIVIIEADDADKSVYDFKRFYDSMENWDITDYVVDVTGVEYAPIDFLSILVKIYDICDKKKASRPTLRVKNDSLIINLLRRAQFGTIFNIEGV